MKIEVDITVTICLNWRLHKLSRSLGVKRKFSGYRALFPTVAMNVLSRI